MAKETLPIIYTPTIVAEYLILELDSEANEDRTSFLPGEKVFLRVYGSGYTMNSSAGTLTQEASSRSRSIEETFYFVNEKTKTLSYLPSGDVTYEWIGASCGIPIFQNQVITLEANCLSVLECEYNAEYDQWSISWDEEGVIIVTATLGDITRNIQITFAEFVPGAKTFLSLILDSEYNDERTEFDSGETVYLLCYAENSAPYLVTSSAGDTRIVTTDISIDVEDEIITFANSDSGNLAYPLLAGSMQYEWIGDDGGVPVFEGKNITLPEVITGILQCTYKTLVDRISLVWAGEGTVLVTVIQTIDEEQHIASQQVVYTELDLTPIPYDLEIKDFCDDEIVGGVEVFLDGVSIGTTNADGIIYLGALIPGSTHQLKMIKTGFIDSDLDKLSNDSFTVPS